MRRVPSPLKADRERAGVSAALEQDWSEQDFERDWSEPSFSDAALADAPPGARAPTHASPTPRSLLAAVPIQAALKVSKPEDELEREADRVADHVMRMPAAGAVAPAAKKDDEEKLSRAPAKKDDEEKLSLAPVKKDDEEKLSRTVGAPARSSGAPLLRVADDEELDREVDEEATEGGDALMRACASCATDDDERRPVQRAASEEMPETRADEVVLRAQMAHAEHDQSDEEEEDFGMMGPGRRQILARSADPSWRSEPLGPELQRACSSCQSEDDEARKQMQRACSSCQDEEEKAPVQRAPASSTNDADFRVEFENALERQRAGGGEPLPASLRGWMEDRFQQDFSQVRLHRGTSADALTRGVQARAFTIGHDLFFRSGEFQPDTEQGKHLIAHELTHVVQQREGMRSVARDLLQRRKEPSETVVEHGDDEREPALRRPTSGTRGRPASPTDAAERQADELGALIASDLPAMPGISSGLLPEPVRDVAEKHLRTDLAGTRLVADRVGQFRAASLSALAVTHGSTISFAAGQLDATSEEGRALLGHELTHVAQQREHGLAGIPQRREDALDVPPERGNVPPADVVGADQDVREGQEAKRELQATDLKKEVPRVEPAKASAVHAADAKAEKTLKEPAGDERAENPEGESANAKTAAGDTPVTETAASIPTAPAATIGTDSAAGGVGGGLATEVANPAVAQALSAISGAADAEVSQVHAIAAQARKALTDSIVTAKSAVADKLAAAKKSVAQEFEQRKAGARGQKDSASKRAATGFEQGHADITKAGDVKDRATQLGQQTTTDATTTATAKQGEGEAKANDTAGQQEGGIFGLVKSAMIVKLGAAAGTLILEGAKALLGKIGSFVADMVAKASEGLSTILGEVARAFASALEILPATLQSFVGNLGKGQSATLAQIEQLGVKANESLDRTLVTALGDISRNEDLAVAAIGQARQAASDHALELHAGFPNDEVALSTGLDVLVQKSRAAYANVRQDFSEHATQTTAKVAKEASEGPGRLAAELEKVTGPSKGHFGDLGKKFGTAMSQAVDMALGALKNVASSAATAFNTFLEKAGEQLKDLLSGLVDWAVKGIASLGGAFLEAGRRAVAWATEKLSVTSLLGITQAKLDVIQRGFWSGVGKQAWDLLKTLGVVALIAGIATAVLSIFFGPIVAIGIVGLGLIVLIVYGIIRQAIDVFKRMQKGVIGKLPLYFQLQLFGPIFIWEFIGVFPLMSALLGEDVLSGDKLSDEERGRHAFQGAFDLVLSIFGGELFDAASKAVKATKLGAAALEGLGELAEGLGKAVEGLKTAVKVRLGPVLEGLAEGVSKIGRAIKGALERKPSGSKAPTVEPSPEIKPEPPKVEPKPAEETKPVAPPPKVYTLADAEAILRSSEGVPGPGSNIGHAGDHIPLNGEDPAVLAQQRPTKPLTTTWRLARHAYQVFRDILNANSAALEALPAGGQLGGELAVVPSRPGFRSVLGNDATVVEINKVSWRIWKAPDGRLHVVNFAPAN